MEKFTYRVVLQVEVDAFDETEAWDAIQDNFGIGQGLGLTVTSCEYQ